MVGYAVKTCAIIHPSQICTSVPLVLRLSGLRYPIIARYYSSQPILIFSAALEAHSYVALLKFKNCILKDI